MRLSVNGKDTEMETGIALKTLLENLLGPSSLQGIAVAVNEAVVPRNRWDEQTLQEGDRVEVIRAVQGG